MKRLIQRKIMNPLAKLILRGGYDPNRGAIVTISLPDGESKQNPAQGEMGYELDDDEGQFTISCTPRLKETEVDAASRAPLPTPEARA